jgi:hypothetical protein
LALVTGIAQRIKIRLFVEGVEIPCISASVQAAPNSPVMCSLQILPLAEATRFAPRSLVHLFFVDEFDTTVPNLRTTNTDKSPGPTVYEQVRERQGREPNLEFADSDLNDFRLQKYKLMFVGEIMGFSWTKTPRNRAVVLQCADLSNYWDYAYQHNNTDLFGPGYKAMFSGGSTNLFTDFLSSPGEIMSKILQTPSARYPGLKGLLGGIVHMLEAMGGSYYYDKKFAGQNIFFSIAELRLHLTQMITAFEKDPTSSRLMGGGWDPLFGRSLGNLGDQASFRTCVSKLQSFIFHETYGQPCPRFVPGTGGSTSGFKRTRLKEIPELVEFLVSAQALASTLQATVDALGSDAPAETQREIIRPLIDQIRTAVTGCQTMARSAGRVSGEHKEVGKKISGVYSAASTLLGQVRALLGGGTSRALINPKDPTRRKAIGLLQKVIAQLKTLERMESNVTQRKNAIPATLKQQIFRPDVWFSAPPRCNVIFPDHYMQLSYSRQFMAEPSRLSLKTHDEFFGEDELFDNFYFAPKSPTVREQKNTLANILRNDLMDHELFTGILPVFEKMGEFNIFGARAGVVDGKVPKIGMAQRTTNFLYFKYRFAARQLSVNCRFNPYVAVGFPGLILDRHVDVTTLRSYSQAKGATAQGEAYASKLPPMLGTHFLANFTEVSHQIDQRNGATTINCSYAREANESVEFLGAKQESVTGERPTDEAKGFRSTDVAALFPPLIGSMGPGQGRITVVEDVTSTYTVGGSSKALPLLGADRDKKTKQLTLTVPVGQRLLAKEYGAAVVPYIGDENIFAEFRAYKVTETITKQTRETVYLPPEEYIRPGWYGDCWAPSKISEVYYDFFGVGAITEATQIQNTDGNFEGGLYGTNDAASQLRQIADTNEDLKVAKDQIIALSQTKDATIADAVALLVLTYSVAKHGSFDIEALIKAYTWRPIATLLDMFGSNDLMLTPDGLDVAQGIEGFHSRAFGPWDNLFGLVPPEINDILDIKEGSAASKRADTRKRKRDLVLAYKATLELGRVILG